ncbi:MAG: ComEC/Rec2 family competence protein [bacterium]|nr:ComEC/Rec2 family competence protein [bacterium]
MIASHILWAIVGGFLLGVFARSFVSLGNAFVLFLLLLAGGSMLLALLERAKMRGLVVAAVALTACASGILRMDAAGLHGAAELTSRIGETITIEGRVIDEPDVRDSNVRLHMDTGDVGVLVVAPPHTEVRYGDIIRTKGKLDLPETFDTNDGRQFNYPMFLAKDGILYTLSFAEVDVTGHGPTNPLKVAAIRTKQKYLEGLHRVLPEPESGLAGGITVGDKRGVGKEFSNIFITVGLVHIIVLSGYNITLVMNAVGIFFSRTPRLVQLGASALIMVLIVLMAGAPASASRAGTMALLPLIARMTGRLYLALRALGVVALAMVLWNPFILTFDPGFQLSVLATLGLVLFSPVFTTWLPWIPEKFALREIAAATLGTQTSVLPLLLYQNGLLSLVALPANLLALVAVPYAMFASVIAAIGGIIAGPLAIPVAAPALALLWYILGVAKFFASLPFAAVSVSAFSVWWVFIAYALMFGGLWFLQKKRRGLSPPL